MTTSKRGRIALALALGLGWPLSRGWAADTLALRVETQSLKRARLERVLPLLGLRPGMTVLDLGAGTGQESALIARALQGTGRVYATDVDARQVRYVAGQARRLGLKNLEAVLVRPGGVDPFYARHRYDLVLLSDTDLYLSPRSDYYRRLREQLNPGGKVIVVDSDAIPDRLFYPEDVADWSGLAARLRQEPAGSPLRAELDASARRPLLSHLNRLVQGELFTAYADGLKLKPGLGLTPAEDEEAAWILHRLALDGLPGAAELPLWPVHDYGLAQMLNKLILIGRLRPFLRSAGGAPYWSSAPEVRWYAQHDRRAEAFEAAGFTLAAKAELPPFWAAWTFSR